MALFRKNTEPGERLKTQELDNTGLPDLPYLFLTVLLVSIGVLMMFSASYVRADFDTGNPAFYFTRQAVFAVGGILVMLLVGRLNYFIWFRLAIPILAVSMLLLALLAADALLMKFGVIHSHLPLCVEHNGAIRWMRLGIEFQPSEIAKVGMILTFSAMMSVWQEKIHTFRYGVLPYALIMGLLVGMLVCQPHLSGILIIAVTGASIMLIGGTRKFWFLIGLAVIAVFLVVYLKGAGYAGDRVTAWRDPEADIRGKGYQIIQSQEAIGSGGLLGLGFGRSRQKHLYLPEGHNDYIFAIVCEELGIIGAVGIILLFILLILRGYWIALHARDRFGTLVAAGFTTKLAIQVFFNIGVVTNLLPATGISLPLFSYGGTALLMQLFEMGVVLSVSRWGVNKRAVGRRKEPA